MGRQEAGAAKIELLMEAVALACETEDWGKLRDSDMQKLFRGLFVWFFFLCCCFTLFAVLIKNPFFL